MKSQVIDTGYRPRKHQAYIHSQLKRFNVLVCHRRFGKTTLCANETLDQGLNLTEHKNPQYAYVAPTYSAAKRIAWDIYKEICRHFPGVKINEAELRIDIPRQYLDDRIRIFLAGGENFDALRGVYLDGVVLDEYGDMDPRIWGTVLRPALSDRMGWCIFIGTPKGKNHFYDLYEQAKNTASDQWFHAIFKASDTRIIPEIELEEAKMGMLPEEYEQEFECSFSSTLVGAYYGKYIKDAENEKRIKEVPSDPALTTLVAWDLGIGDSTAIWFVQISGNEIRVIDYLEDHGRSLDWYAREIRGKGYVIDKCILPHDARVRSLETGKTRISVIENLLGVRCEINPQERVDEGIHQVRMILPRCWFDEKKCKLGLDALRNYQRKYDPKEKVYLKTPKHDWSSHGADAFRMLALGLRNYFKPKKEKQRRVLMDWDIYDV